MKTLVKACLFAWCMATGCAAVGCCGAVIADDKNDCGVVTGTPNSTASGTFTDSASGVSATISGATIFVERDSSGGVTSSVVELTATNLTFSTPAGVTTSDFVCDISLTSAPSTGTVTQTTTGAAGGVSITYEDATTGDTYSAESASDGEAATGSWSLDFSSVNQFCGDSDISASLSEYTVHGTLSATMVDDSTPPNTGTLTMTF